MNKPSLTPAVTRSDDTRMTSQICLANGRLVLPDRIMTGGLTLSGGKIEQITEGTTVPDGAEDMGGDYLCPGMIELHTDNLERHIQPRPQVDWPHRAAIFAHDAELAGCGITTVFDAMRVGSFKQRKSHSGEYARSLATELLETRATGALRISHHLHLRAEICSETLLEELAKFGPDDRIGLVSLMDHTPGQRQFRDMTQFRAYWQGKYGLSDAEFDQLVVKLKTLSAEIGERHEAGAVAEAARIGATLASHDDTTLEQVAHSVALGIKLAEFPTTREAAAACVENGIAVIMGAPNLIRGGSHSGNVSAAELAHARLIDIVSSDYVPSGLLLAAFQLAAIWDDLPRAIGTVTAAPARASGLLDRGEIVVGKRADLIRVGTTGTTPMVRATYSNGIRVA